jgi:hypothetical protein
LRLHSDWGAGLLPRTRLDNAGNASGDALYATARLGQADGMFVIELIYKADLGAIDAHMAAHMKFLKK